MQAKKSSRAPYTKYAKIPYQYSEPYQQWKAALLKGDKAEIARQAARHNRLYMPNQGRPIDPR